MGLANPWGGVSGRDSSGRVVAYNAEGKEIPGIEMYMDGLTVVIQTGTRSAPTLTYPFELGSLSYPDDLHKIYDHARGVYFGKKTPLTREIMDTIVDAIRKNQQLPTPPQLDM